jgi:hypothetical protein
MADAGPRSIPDEVEAEARETDKSRDQLVACLRREEVASIVRCDDLQRQIAGKVEQQHYHEAQVETNRDWWEDSEKHEERAGEHDALEVCPSL